MQRRSSPLVARRQIGTPPDQQPHHVCRPSVAREVERPVVTPSGEGIDFRVGSNFRVDSGGGGGGGRKTVATAGDSSPVQESARGVQIAGLGAPM